MRHAGSDTTMACYVALATADVADELWAKFATCNIAYNNQPQQFQETQKAPANESTEALDC